MKIAFIVLKHIARGGGIEKYTLELGSRLVKLGHEVKVYSTKHYGQVPAEYRGMKLVPIPSIPMWQFEKITACSISSLHAAFDNWADIIHLHGLTSGATAWLARLCSRPCLVQVHGLEWKRTRSGWLDPVVAWTMERLAVLANTRITAVSRILSDYLEDKYRVEVEHIPCGTEIKPKIEADEILRMGLEPGKYVLFASRLVRVKGAHCLIPAFRKLKTDYKLVIAGDVQGEDKYKSELLKLADGDSRILFPGYVEGRALEELFSNAAVYAQPSVVEGLSIALLEAMSYGLCCVVSDIPENLEATGECSVTFESENIDDLSDTLDRVVNSPSQRESIGRQARSRVEGRYSWDTIARQFESFYQRILRERD